MPFFVRCSVRLAAVVLAIGLASCGGGGGGGSSGGAPEQPADLSGRHFLPAAVGDRWLYTDSGGANPVFVKVSGSQTVDGQTGATVHSDDGAGDALLVEDAQGVKQIPLVGNDSLTTLIGPLQLLRYPLTLGDTYTNVSKSLGTVIDFDGDGVGDATSVQGTVEVIAVETVNTPVGTLVGCLHTRTTTVFTIQLSVQRRSLTLTQTVNDWLAPGIGLVRSQQQLSADGTSDTFTREIAAYGVGSLRSEYVAPSATAAGIANGAALGPTTTVGLAFDEDIDQDSLPGALTVVDSAGNAVSGTVSVAARAAHFTPATPFSTGNFSARFAATATDLVGNPAVASTWNFTIDATSPALLGTQPLEGSVDVPLASAIALQFSEPVLASSVSDSSILVLYDGSVLTQVTYQVSGSQVMLTPRTALARGKQYSIRIDGVTDLAGNPLTATQLLFTTDPGRFGPPVPLSVLGPDMAVGSAVAIGDVNGDGRPDIVAGSVQFVGGAWQFQLAVYLRQSDGSPGAPILIPLQGGGAQAISIAIADVDGDGRKDVVVGEGVGVEIFLQASDGHLMPGQAVSTGTTARMQVVDMNGDGRMDIVTYGANVISVWLNLPGGWTLNDAVTVTSYPGSRDLAVGDINGDGRPDIVYVGDSMPSFAAAGILKQGADGHLLNPELLFDGNNGTAFSLLVGDVDGDGRSDIVLGLASGPRLWSQRPDGTLAPMTFIDGEPFAGALKLADINGDGLPDIITVDGLGTLAVRLRQSDGTWAPTALYPGDFLGTAPDAAAVAVGDIDGDGRPDVLAGGNRFMQRPVPITSQAIRLLARSRHLVR